MSTHSRESQAAPTGAKFKDKGLLLQASYAWKAPVVGARAFWEVAFRYSGIDPSRPGHHLNDRTEIGGGFNYYYNKHNLKVQADFRQHRGRSGNSGKGTKTKEFRLQTQFYLLGGPRAELTRN